MADSGNEKPNVLVVDDEEDTADLYARVLSPDYVVRTAYNGTEALEADLGKLDIVLLDRRMPDISGDEVLKRMRLREADCRIIFVTAIEPDMDLISLDFDDYLVKPVSSAELTDAVERMITRNKIDDKILDAFALASKMATLESKMDPAELEASPEYSKLQSKFEGFRELFSNLNPEDDLYAKLSTMKMEALFSE